MAPIEVILIVVGLGVGLVTIPIGRRIWTNQWRWAYDPNNVPAAWPYGAALWRGLTRIHVLGLIAMPVGALMLLFDQGFDGEAADVLATTFAVALVTVVVAGWLVILLNRPTFLVPPHLRQQPGALREWRGAPVKATPRPAHRPLLVGRRTQPQKAHVGGRYESGSGPHSPRDPDSSG